MDGLDQHTDLPAPADASWRTTAEEPRLFEVVGQHANPRVEWVEIKVKSVLNRVQGMPFKWSINPYRGCAHACVYCLEGDTPILMADGGVKPLEELSIGDGIYGTARGGRYRRYVPTQVLAHWCIEKPAYRVVLEGGTELIASGDHRFLTDRGWKSVTGSEQGRARRPHLTTGNKLMGVGALASRKRDIAGQTVKHRARLGVTRIEPVGARRLFDITTGTGDFIANGVVSHNCYARVTHWYLDQDGVNDWSSRIFVKVNAPEVLRRELARPAWQREQVHLGTATDPYQPAEGAYRLTRQILEALRDSDTPAALVTKSTMVVRDRDLLRSLARGPGAMVMFSITTVDPSLAQEIEPDVPPPQKRLGAMRRLAEAGIPVGVLLAPVLPGITDDEDLLAAVIETAKAHGASALYTNALHLGDVTREAFFDYLEHKRPELLAPYTRLYRGKYAPRAYQQRVKEVVAAIKARVQFAPVERREEPAARPAAAPPTPGTRRSMQTRLW